MWIVLPPLKRREVMLRSSNSCEVLGMHLHGVAVSYSTLKREISIIQGEIVNGSC